MENARRCRIILRHPCSTVLDLRLFAQVEVRLPFYLCLTYLLLSDE